MPTVSVNLSDTFEEWRTKTNTIGTSAGDLSSLNTTDKSSLVAALNEVITNDSDDMENLIDDTNPQLGGDLDLNNNNITGTGTISATGTITALGGFVGAINVVSDTSPSLGGDLDLNNNNITGTGSIADTVTGITQSPSDNSTKLATTAYVDAQVSTENTIEEMNDTTITTPTNGQQLVYNSTTSKWENVTSTTATQGFAVAVAIALG
jgi:trimeric autotransporter adhesin